MKPRFFLLSSKYYRIRIQSSSKRVIEAGKYDSFFAVEIIVETGNRKWPELWVPIDRLIIIREDVAAVFDLEEMEGLRWLPVRILNPEEDGIRGMCPGYRCLLPSNGVEIDFDWLALRERAGVPTPASLNLPDETRFVPVGCTWNDTDVFACSNFPTAKVWCTQKLLKLARREKWKDFQFEPMDLPWSGSLKFKGKGIDIWGKGWPPQWYPEGYEGLPENLVPDSTE